MKFSNIKTIIFDIDNTLLETHKYYEQAVYDCAMSVSKKYYSPKEDRKKFSQQVVDEVNNIYNAADLSPLLIEDTVIEAIHNLGKETDKQILWLINFRLKNFYYISPPPYQDTYDTLKELIKKGYKIFLHSHAQEEWTKIKIDILEKELGIKIPYLATPITQEKDKNSWKKAIELSQTDINNTLIVGDNLKADILSSIEAGCKNLVLLNKNIDISNMQISKDIHLIKIDNIKELLEYL